AINAEVDALLNLHDAVSDVLLSESVYQVVQGNFERSAANTDAFSKGNYPPEPDVVRTPRSGTTLIHRVALHLDASASSNTDPAVTARALSEAPLSTWLASRLPRPEDVVCRVTYATPALVGEREILVTQHDLGLQAIDLLYLTNLDVAHAMTELDD